MTTARPIAPDRELLAASKRILTALSDVLNMPADQRAWWLSKEGHRDACALTLFTCRVVEASLLYGDVELWRIHQAAAAAFERISGG